MFKKTTDYLGDNFNSRKKLFNGFEDMTHFDWCFSARNDTDSCIHVTSLRCTQRNWTEGSLFMDLNVGYGECTENI